MDGGIELEVGGGRNFTDFIARQRQGLGGRDTPGVGCDVVYHAAAALMDDFIYSTLKGCSCRGTCDGVGFGGIFVDLNLTCDGLVDPFDFRRAARAHIDRLIFLV